MYIPIGPSKKQLYKIIIALLLLCYLIFLGMYKPKAMAITDFSVIQNYNSGSQCVGTKSVGTNVREVIISPIYYSGGCTLNNNIRPDWDYIIIPIILYSSEWANHTSGDTQTYEVLSNSVQVWLNTIGGDIFCDYDGLYATCPFKIANAQKLNNINILYSKGNGPQSAIYYRIANDWLLANSKSSTINNIQNNTQDISNNLNDSSIDSSSANNLTNNSAFQDSNGLDSIIKAPLNFIQSLTSSTCSSISLTIPYIDANVSLPCMSTIYNKALGTQLVNLIALVINGIVLYRYCLKILQLVHNAKNPNKDELEVLDL